MAEGGARRLSDSSSESEEPAFNTYVDKWGVPIGDGSVPPAFIKVPEGIKTIFNDEETHMRWMLSFPDIAGRYTDADPYFRDDKDPRIPPIVLGYNPRTYNNRGGQGGSRGGGGHWNSRGGQGHSRGDQREQWQSRGGQGGSRGYDGYRGNNWQEQRTDNYHGKRRFDEAYSEDHQGWNQNQKMPRYHDAGNRNEGNGGEWEDAPCRDQEQGTKRKRTLSDDSD